MKKTILLLLILFLIVGCKAKIGMELGETTASSADMITYITYTDPQNLYSFERPRYWIDKSQGITIEFDGPSNHGVYYTIVTTLVASKSQGGLYETKEAAITALESQWSKEAQDYKRFTLGTTTVDNREAAEIIVAFTRQGNRYKTKQIVFESDKGIFIRIAYNGPEEDFNDYMPVMDTLLETFKIIDTTGRI